MSQNFDTIIEKITDTDERYKEDAYEFVMDALAFSQKKFKSVKHVTGEQLLEGIKLLLMREFGPMTLRVLEHWGIKSTEDFGNIVFNLVKNRVLSKTEDDDIKTFQDGYDFEEVFDHGYRQRLHKRISRMRS